MSARTYLSIGDVLTLLREEFPDVTISKIRFLESQRLINPERSPSGYRKFYDADVERLRWVLRQQRDHFLPLRVIRDRLARAGNGVPDDEPAVAPRPVDATLGVDATEERRDVAVGTDEQLGSDRADVGRAPVAARVASAPAATRLAGHVTNGTTELSSDPAVAMAGTTTGEDRGGPVATEGVPPGPPPARHDPVVHERSATAAGAGGSGGDREPSSPAATTGPATRATGGTPADNGLGRPDHDASPESGPVDRAAEPVAETAPADDAPAAGEDAGPAHASARPPVPPGERPPAHAAPDATELEVPVESEMELLSEVPPVAGPAPGPADAPSASEGAAGASHAGSLTLEELSDATGLPAAQIAALQSFGLLEPVTVAGATFYDEEAVTVARLAADLAKYGIEPRHLRMYRTAVDRELGLVEQVVSPLLRQRNPSARQRAVEAAEELATLGEQLRSSLIRRELRKQLGR